MTRGGDPHGKIGRVSGVCCLCIYEVTELLGSQPKGVGHLAADPKRI